MRQPRSRADPSRKAHRWRTDGVGVPRGRSKEAKKTTAKIASVAPLLQAGPLSVADFDQSEWEIMYPHFVEECLVDPPGCVNKKNV
jgi:hypothetical protein